MTQVLVSIANQAMNGISMETNWLPFKEKVNFEVMDHFGVVLEDLCTVSCWKNPKSQVRLAGLLDSFKYQIRTQINLEERVIFPFLEKHIPRLQSIQAFLKLEHYELQLALKPLKEFASELSKTPEQSTLSCVYKQGLMLSNLVRVHLLAENTGIYRVAEKELHVDEKQILAKKIQLSRSEAWYKACF